jgi:hypothetical protein
MECDVNYWAFDTNLTKIGKIEFKLFEEEDRFPFPL